MCHLKRGPQYAHPTMRRSTAFANRATLAWFVLVAAIGCGGPVTPPTDQREGLGGTPGTSDVEHKSPAVRTAHGQAPRRLSSDEQQAVAQFAARTEIVEAASRASTQPGSPQFAVLAQELRERRIALMRALNVISGYTPVEYAGRTTFEYELFRRQTESLEGRGLEAALLAQLAAVYEQDLANLGLLSPSSNAEAQRFAEKWSPQIRADVTRVQQSAHGSAPQPSASR